MQFFTKIIKIMANMSYCRFENTARDLRDCVQAIENGEHTDDLSSYEKGGLEEILSLCEQLFFMKEEIEESLEQVENYEQTRIYR